MYVAAGIVFGVLATRVQVDYRNAMPGMQDIRIIILTLLSAYRNMQRTCRGTLQRASKQNETMNKTHK